MLSKLFNFVYTLLLNITLMNRTDYLIQWKFLDTQIRFST